MELSDFKWPFLSLTKYASAVEYQRYFVFQRKTPSKYFQARHQPTSGSDIRTFTTDKAARGYALTFP